MTRDTSLDDDTGEFEYKDPSAQRTFIMQQKAIPVLQHQRAAVLNERLVFIEGVFGHAQLRRLVKPTHKGFWVDISIQSQAVLMLDDMIGLQNCSEHLNGAIELSSKSLRGFDPALWPVKSIGKLAIHKCPNLLNFANIPTVTDELIVDASALKHKGNIRHILNACVHSSKLVLAKYTVLMPALRARDLTHLLNTAIQAKAGAACPRKVALKLQQELIDNDFDEFAGL